MKPNNFYNWKDYKSAQKIKKVSDRPYLNDIKRVTVTRGSFQLHYSLNYNEKEPLAKLDFLQNKICKTGIPAPSTQSGCCGIDGARKADIISKLLPLMPKSRQWFWQNLPGSSSEKTCEEPEQHDV